MRSAPIAGHYRVDLGLRNNVERPGHARAFLHVEDRVLIRFYYLRGQEAAVCFELGSV